MTTEARDTTAKDIEIDLILSENKQVFTPHSPNFLPAPMQGVRMLFGEEWKEKKKQSWIYLPKFIYADCSRSLKEKILQSYFVSHATIMRI